MKLTSKTIQDTNEAIDSNAVRAEFCTKPFAEMMSSEADVQRTFTALESSIMRSFAEDIQRAPFSPRRGMTRAEISRRFRICENWIRHARGDLGYSLERTLDLLHHALRSELDGEPFDPHCRPGGIKLWTPT